MEDIIQETKEVQDQVRKNKKKEKKKENGKGIEPVVLRASI